MTGKIIEGAITIFSHDYRNSLMDEYGKILDAGEIKPKEQLQKEHAIFRKRFGPDVLSSLDGEMLIDTIFNVMNREGLAYWLEFKNDEDFDTSQYGSVAGGSALKYIIYKRKWDDNWVTGSSHRQDVLSLGEAIRKGCDIRDAILRGAEAIGRMHGHTIDDYIALQAELDSEPEYRISTYGWIHKYYHMIFPDKIDAFHSTIWQKHALFCMGKKPKADSLYILAGQIMREINALAIPSSHALRAMVGLFGSPTSYYRVGTRSSSGTSMWEEMSGGGYVSIGWREMGNLEQYVRPEEKETKAYIQYTVGENYPNIKQVVTRETNEIIRFYQGIKENDLVAACDGERVLGIGRVVGGYEYHAEREFPHIRRVEWLYSGQDKLPSPKEGLRTSVTQYKDYDNILQIRELARRGHIEPVTSAAVTPAVKPLPPLAEEIRKIVDVLERKKQVILYGPPGTGKTYHAEKAARELAARKQFNRTFDSLSAEEKSTVIGDGRTAGLVRMCCFHPSYGYEDFIEGIKPRAENGVTLFEMRDGVFKTLCIEAEKFPQRNNFLIIDEINRGDISRIFGELITLIESGKRGKTLTLPVSGDVFSVPPNVYIIGTMNTADRSIALLDAALRRRFGFRELMPEYELLGGVSFDSLPLAEWLRQLNQRICHNLGKDARNLQIGHSYFMEGDKAITSKGRFKQVVSEDILPLIEEYCYGDYTAMTAILGSSLVDEGKQTLRYHLFDGEFADLINALLQPCVDIQKTEDNDSDAPDDDALEDAEQ